MLRVSLCAVFVAVAFGLGVDDTEKRRSEEILRAVAAAATADYEGLQQMKFQKATTGGKITSTSSTGRCVAALKAALEEEREELIASSATENTKMNDQNEGEGSQSKITAEKVALKKALHKALETTYMSIHNQYARVRAHAEAMMSALQAEVSERNCNDDGTGDCATRTDATDTFTNEGESIFKAIVAATSKQLSPTTKDAFDATKTGASDSNGNVNTGFSDAVMMILQDIMLAHANDEAYERLTPDGSTNAEKVAVESDLIKIASILAGPEKYDQAGNLVSGTEASPGTNHYSATMTGPGHHHDVNGHNLTDGHGRDAVSGPGGDGHSKAKTHMINFEQAKLITIEKAFVNYVRSKSLYHNTSTKITALEAAVNMVDAKIRAVGTAKTKISDYSSELQGLEDDEMRKIHDIKEEFESLAADWLQLATYHCCDIVQGNAIECDDATAHLIAPINTVFPNALRKPNVQTDCTRRLL